MKTKSATQRLVWPLFLVRALNKVLQLSLSTCWKGYLVSNNITILLNTFRSHQRTFIKIFTWRSEIFLSISWSSSSSSSSLVFSRIAGTSTTSPSWTEVGYMINGHQCQCQLRICFINLTDKVKFQLIRHNHVIYHPLPHILMYL